MCGINIQHQKIMNKTPTNKPIDMKKFLETIQKDIDSIMDKAITENEKLGNKPFVKVLRQQKAEYDKAGEILRSVRWKK